MGSGAGGQTRNRRNQLQKTEENMIQGKKKKKEEENNLLKESGSTNPGSVGKFRNLPKSGSSKNSSKR